MPDDTQTTVTACACGCGEPATRGKRFRYGHADRPSPLDYREEDRGHATPCWIWQRALNTDGLGQLTFKGRTRSARRVVYERKRGPIPPGHVLEAKCAVDACVNPEHMDPLTHAEALRRRGITTPPRRPKRDVCAQGHPFTPENTITVKHGRRCRTCAQDRQRAFHARKVAAEQATPTPPPLLTDPPETLQRCKQGHLIAGENASPTGTGRFRCRICRNAAAAERYRRNAAQRRDDTVPTVRTETRDAR